MKIRNRVAGMVGALLLAGTATVALATQASAASDYHEIKNAAYQQCVNAPNGVLNVRLQLAPCNASSGTQLWALVPTGAPATYYIVNATSGFCMEVNNGTSTPGETVDEYFCDGLASEQWVEDLISIRGVPYVHFRHAGTNECLDTVSGAGSQLMQWDCDSVVASSNTAQAWTVI